MVAAMTAMMLSSCKEINGYLSSSQNEPSEPEAEEVVEKPQKTEGFYERLLEDFCRRYYKDCFDINYKENSLRITRFNLTNNVASIMGVHSYKGWSSHKDVAFTAMVKEKEEDYYEVFFCKDVEYLFDDENGQEAATRNMTYRE